MKTISVIIPIYNSEKYLKDLFNSLNKCNFYDNDEIILIDNGSTDKSKYLCMEQVKNNSIYKYLQYIDKADSYASRNYGVSNAVGDILAFIDSDCKPTAEWLNLIRNDLKKGEVYAGNIVLEIIDKQNVWECFDAVAHLNQCEVNASKGCVATASMSVHKNDFINVGNFVERFSGGDFEWSKRAANYGLKIILKKKAIVYHPTRKTFNETKIKEERIAYGRGKQFKLDKKPMIILVFLYLLRIFKIDTQIKFSNEFRKFGVKIKNIIYFNFCFLIIRLAYVKYVVKGYKGIDARKLGLK